jgi:hypothetical protein
MLKEFVEKICDLSICTAERGGRLLTSKPLIPVRETEPAPLKARTLAAVLEYAERFASEDMESGDVFVHVEDFRTVHIRGRLYGAENQRDTFLTAEAYEVAHKFGANLTLEDFIVYLQSAFVQDENTARILRVVGNIVEEGGTEYADDGVTQRVTARSGITRREIVDLPNPVELRPYRTFPDAEQPQGLFVLRIRPSVESGGKPTCMLVEADGGAWKNKAIANIKQWFADNHLSVGILG